MNDIVFVGDWIKDRVLGSGSFGTVVLWKHKKTEEKLAIKTCKWGDELTDKHRDRWTKEVEMLQSCRNPNIVGSKPLPSEFIKGLERGNPSGLPIMCMEYCSGGDLRQQLNKPESCSGLREIQVRQILSDIRNAMKFLHQKKITHRDLKPENIVMNIVENTEQNNISPQTEPRVIYKLIDLGYAKEIDFNSVCASFVGTLQYLAPELLYSKTYSNSVDFWSFGLLAFEIICGKRPFLPFMSPAQWMPHVEKKTHENICVYETFHGDIEYSNNIFPENHMSVPFKVLMEDWLRIALEWDPKLRGRDSHTRVRFNIPTEQREVSSNIIIYDLLENILSRKIIRIFSVPTLSRLAYQINDTTMVSDLKKWIGQDTSMDIPDLILICPNTFTELGEMDIVSNYWREHCNTMVYLFNKTYILQKNIEPEVPKSVQRCLEHPKALYNHKNSQTLYKNSLYFVKNQSEIYESLINGLLVRGESLKNEGKQLLLKHNAVDKSISNLLAKEEIMKRLIETGKEQVNKLRDSGKGINMLGGFNKTFQDTDEHFLKISKLQQAWNQLSVRLTSAKRRCNEIVSDDIKNFVAKYNYQAVYANAFKIYIMARKSEIIGKEKHCDDIMKICYNCLKLRSKILLEIHHQPFVVKLMDLGTEFSKISNIVTKAAENTEKLTKDLSDYIDDLNNCIWSTINLAVSDGDNLADIPYSVVSFEKKDFKIGGPVSKHCQKLKTTIPDDDKLKSLIEDSLKLRLNQVSLSAEVNSQRELLKTTIFDFSFLNECIE